MTLNDYYASLDPAQKKAFAKKAKTTTNYIAQIKSDYPRTGKRGQKGVPLRKPSVAMTMRLVNASGGALTLNGLRPDVWA